MEVDASAPGYIPWILSRIQETGPQNPDKLSKLSDGLLESFQDALQNSTISMLPSFTSRLPNGTESGTTVALDLGGSTLRVAIIQLRPHPRVAGDDPSQLSSLMLVLSRQSWQVSDFVKKLPSDAFFDWITQRIKSVLASAGFVDAKNLMLGVTWSFPIAQTSAASGLVKQMGKGFEQWRTIQETELKSHFDAAFRRSNLHLKMTSLVNDTEATLLSHAYVNPSTRLSLIWGTGLNAAAFLPVRSISTKRMANRPAQWMREAEAVVVNTEISMFGGDILPLTSADYELDQNSAHSGFQPLEQMTSGRYLGEICRLILIEAIRRKEIFEGELPRGIEEPYSFDTAICSAFEEQDPSKGPEALTRSFDFKSLPTGKDLKTVRTLCDALSTRSACLIAAMLFSLSRLQNDDDVNALTNIASAGHVADGPIVIAFCGAVAEKHATALRKAQNALDLLVEKSALVVGRARRRLVLEAAGDSGLLGAAVGAVMEGEKLPVKPRL